MILFENYITTNRAAFISRVKEIATKIDVPADWLMLVMAFETGKTFSPSAKNPYSSATGLIQFMDSTARELGTTTAQLAAMSNVQQLDYVEKYLLMRKKQYGMFNHPVDLYLSVFYPAAIKKPMDYVFPNWVYSANKVFDRNRDQQITKSEIQDKILSYVPAQQREQLKKK